MQESLLRQAKLNAKEKHLGGTAIYGVNQFSDWTPEEFRGNHRQVETLTKGNLLLNVVHL